MLAVAYAAVALAPFNTDGEGAGWRVVESIDVDLGDAPVEPDRFVRE